MVLLLALWLSCFGPAPAQAADRGSAAPSPEPPRASSQAYHSLTLRMTKEEVRRVMGKPSQSTDTLWLYNYDDGTTVEVTFSQKRRVTQVVNYKRRR